MRKLTLLAVFCLSCAVLVAQDAQDAPEAKEPTQRADLADKADALHILIRHRNAYPVSEEPNPERSKEEAKELAAKLRKKVLDDGEDFLGVVKAYSEAPEARRSGEIGTITPGTVMSEEFKTAIFKLEIGEVSPVVESPFGYSVFKRIPVVEIPVWYLYITWKETAFGEKWNITRTKEQARSRAEEALAKLKAGESLRAIADAYTDQPEGDAGGVMGWVKEGELREPLDGTAWGLEPGGLSEVLETDDGYHLVRRMTNEEMETHETWVNEKAAARHIVVQWSGLRNPEKKEVERSRDEAKALIEEILVKLESGISFDALFKQYTDFPKESGGNLGVFTRSEMQPKAMSDAIFALKVGEIGGPVETEVGFHIVQRTEVIIYGAKHILIGFETSRVPIPPSKGVTRDAALAKAEEALRKINSGEMTWDQASKKYSDDPNAQMGGELGEFGSGEMVDAFERALTGIQVGEMSAIIETDFGFHIIIRTK